MRELLRQTVMCNAVAGLALMALTPLCTAAPVRVVVDDGNVVNHAGPDYHGTNLVALWNDTEDSPGAVQAFAQMGLKLVRFPGGVPAQWYDWKQPTASGWTSLTPEDVGAFADAADAAVMFQTNVANDREEINEETGQAYQFDSSAEHQAAWVRFAKDKQINVAYWEIGNEPEMDAPEPIKQTDDQQQIYDWYNQKFAEQARAIKRVDADAVIVGPAATNTWYWWAQHNLKKFMSAHGDKQGTGLVDAVSLHWYPHGGKKSWTEDRGLAQEWSSNMDYINSVLAEFDSRDLPLYITEWNWGGGQDNDSAAKLGTALGNADIVGMFQRTGVDGHAHFCFQGIDRNWGVLAMERDTAPVNSASPTYFALAMAARLVGDVVPVQSSADPASELAAYAVVTADGGRRVMLINKTDASIEANVQFRQMQPDAGRLRVWTLRGAEDSLDDREVIFNGVAHPDPSKMKLPAPAEQPIDGPLPTQMLAPYSVTLVEYEPALP